MSRFAIALTFLAAASAAGAQMNVPSGLMNIGVAAAVHGAVRATPPGRKIGRRIGSGQPVYLNDHVTTGPDGSLQLLLLDQTTFTIGPNSDMVLDDFVYNPRTNAGSVSAQILKGFFRFVTGKIAQNKPSSMTVTTPVGTIGIRGTMVVGHIDGGNAEIALIGPGPENNANERRGGITVSNNYGSTDVDASGYGVRIRDGGKPSRSFRLSPTEFDAILGRLETKSASGRRAPSNRPSSGSPNAASNAPSNAARASGDSTAQGGINSQSWSNLNTVATSFAQTTNLASQAVAGCSGSANCWSDLQAIQSGIVGYEGNSIPFTCNGGGCASYLGTGTFRYIVNVNLATQTIGGDGASYVFINANIGTGGTINAISYAGSRGPAVYTMTDGDVVGGGFAGTTLSFLKGANGPGSTLQFNLQYNVPAANGGGTATGTSVVARQPGPLSY